MPEYDQRLSKFQRMCIVKARHSVIPGSTPHSQGHDQAMMSRNILWQHHEHHSGRLRG